MTVPEMATVLETSENTLRKRLRVALTKLRKTLGVALPATRQQQAVSDISSTHAGYAGSHHDE